MSLVSTAVSLEPTEVSLELSPEHRVEVIDIAQRIRDKVGDVLDPYPKVAYCSYHTTAGYFEQRLCARLNHDQEALSRFVGGFRQLFPEGADYKHDQLDLRNELSEEEKACEPRNADSHLTYISSGLANCVTYTHTPNTPVYFVELDGVNGEDRRRRRTRAIGYHEAREVATVKLKVPVSAHAIDSINIRDPRLGLMDQLQDLLYTFDINQGRIDLRLSPDEKNSGLTVNEYETLLMQHDLVEVLHNPFRFMAEKSKNMLRDPRAIPAKAKNYVKYDLVHILNEFCDVLGLSQNLVERITDKFLVPPARRFMRMKRGVSLVVSDEHRTGRGTIVQGTYQSPILVQWKRAEGQMRTLDVTLTRFE